jgi:hypothetical protein
VKIAEHEALTNINATLFLSLDLVLLLRLDLFLLLLQGPFLLVSSMRFKAVGPQ